MTTIAEDSAGIVRTVIGVDLPVALRAGDGSEAGPVDGPTVVIADRAALRRLYLVGGALAFAERRMGVDQILAIRPTDTGESKFPLVYDWEL